MRVFVSSKRLDDGGNLAMREILTFCVVGVTKIFGVVWSLGGSTIIIAAMFLTRMGCVRTTEQVT
jgi:hypothetical protein